MVKNLPAMQETGVQSLGWEDLLETSVATHSSKRQAWQPTPVFLPAEFYGQRSLVGLQSMGRKESDTTE